MLTASEPQVMPGHTGYLTVASLPPRCNIQITEDKKDVEQQNGE